MDDAIKRKLVGAAVLVVAGLIALPLLTPKGRDTAYLKESVPPMPDAPDMSMPAPKALSIPVSELLEESTLAGEKIVIPSVKVDDETASAQSFQLPSKQPSGQAAIWQIQVASFANQDNALKLRDKLRAQGYKAFEQLSEDGTHTRVFVGPSYQKDELETQAGKIAKRHKLEVKIVPFQPR